MFGFILFFFPLHGCFCFLGRGPGCRVVVITVTFRLVELRGTAADSVCGGRCCSGDDVPFIA